ncbi:ACT domain-containing protein [Dethiosulfatarculus sandiegensis]|uniref:ACT domain-containing protein n=1 Tax=Dethiosulfatarculus sandiegensis TaxID=1429043 RepID=A0A0D2J007_9BACT|nr:ACT domain-containing protein [Dethiosulfatarculus sandiegensis]KIX11549.1 hypothetical protein X474_24235 [Dethiosulfatarculus sandiegensis]
MTVTQLSIRMPNKPGQLVTISEIMGQAEVNILALFVSTTTPGGDGLMRFVPSHPGRAAAALVDRGMEVATSQVLAAETPHHAGGLKAILDPLSKAKVNVDYLYPCIQTGESTILIMGTDQVDQAVEALKKDWIRLYSDQDLLNL